VVTRTFGPWQRARRADLRTSRSSGSIEPFLRGAGPLGARPGVALKGRAIARAARERAGLLGIHLND